MAERLDIVSQSNFPTNKSNTVEIVTTTKKKVTTASASDIATLVTPAISNLDIATQTNFPIQSSDAQSDFIITTDGGVNNVTAEAAAGLISSYIPTGGGDPHKPDFTADYSTNYSDFSNFTGSGTEADPYQIWDEEMFLNARFKVNNGGLSSATYFKQMRDIVWQFDGIGFGYYVSYYDANDEHHEFGNLYDTGYDYFYYDGGNCTLIINNNGFIYSNDFIEDYFDMDAGTFASGSYKTNEFYFFYSRELKNLRVRFTGTPLRSTISMDNSLFNCTYRGKIINVHIEDLRVNNSYANTELYNPRAILESYAEEGIDNCSITNSIIYISEGMYTSFMLSSLSYEIDSEVPVYPDMKAGIQNCTVYNSKLITKATNVYAFVQINSGNIENCYVNNVTIEGTNIKIIDCTNIIDCTIQNINVTGKSLIPFYVRKLPHVTEAAYIKVATYSGSNNFYLNANDGYYVILASDSTDTPADGYFNVLCFTTIKKNGYTCSQSRPVDFKYDMNSISWQWDIGLNDIVVVIEN